MFNNQFTNFVIGTGTPLAGILVSVSTYNAHLQTLSLLIGIAAGLATLINIVRKWFK